jgi:lambda family phage portal protein
MAWYSNIFGKRKQAPRVRAYTAAKVDRLTSDWVMSHTSANAELKYGALPAIRSRARDLERNNPLARKYLLMCEANIVGQSFALKVNSEDEKAREVETAFMRWLAKADVTGRYSAGDLQRAAVRLAARDGEALGRLYKDARFPDGLGVQLLEADFINDQCEVAYRGNTTVMGVALDGFGKPVAYSVYNQHPGDSGYGSGAGLDTTWVTAEKMVHVFVGERPGQTRAASWMAASMMAIRMLDGYREAELVAARIASCKMGFYKIPPGENFGADGSTSNGAPTSDASPGTFEQMPNGWEFQSYDPTHPAGNFAPFCKDIERDIANGFGVAYANLANDLESVNYSSIRAGTIEEREMWKVKQQWFSNAFLRPLYRAWLPMAQLSGTVRLTAKQEKDFLEADVWTGRRWDWVDPSNDIAALKEQVALGITSPSQIAAERGQNFAQVTKQLAADNQLRVGAGLVPFGAPVDKPAFIGGQ